MLNLETQLDAVYNAAAHGRRGPRRAQSQGIELLKQVGEMLGPERKPVVRIRNEGHVSRNVATLFRTQYLTGIIREADKYGWAVDQELKEPNMGWRSCRST